jgi:type II secretory pathway pseudopilin PulG
MKFFSKNRKKKVCLKKSGFTLVELIVVTFIMIALAGVILSATGEARDKAKYSGFRSGTDQFIRSLEMYKNAKGHYPLEDDSSSPTGGFFVSVDSTGAVSASSNPGGLDGVVSTGNEFVNLIIPYLRKITPPVQAGDLFYYRQQNVSLTPVASSYKCVGYGDDTTSNHPPYVITVTNPRGFEDWPFLARWTQAGDGGSWATSTERCFVLK